MQPSQDKSLTLGDVIRHVTETRLRDVHTALPGRVEKYDPSTGKADVKPLVKRMFSDGTEQELPVVPNVPVLWPRTANAILHLPLAKGDGVLLVCSEKPLDLWLSSKMGRVVSPKDRRVFSLTDAVAIPGLWPFTEKTNVDDDSAVELRHKRTVITIRENGEVEINAGNNDVYIVGGNVLLGAQGDVMKRLINETLVTLFNSHTHSGVTSGSAVTGVPTVPLVEETVATMHTKAG